MSEFKGTKEKWVKDITERRNKIIVRIGNRRVIELGTLNNGDCNVPSCCKTEEHANALLISKAPEMLEMLKKILNNSDVPNVIYDEAKQLIKEATEL
jgi:type II secretory pathway component GspD/PulD (secretin)